MSPSFYNTVMKGMPRFNIKSVSCIGVALLTAALTLTTALLAPLICLGVVLLLPFSDRPTQAALLGSWASYLALVGVVLL